MNSKTLTVTLLCGISLANGFFHFKHKDFLFEDEESFNNSNHQNDSTYWIEQPVDHFNSTDQRTWKQKYYREMHSWQPEGPILLYIGGEQDITYQMFNKSYWMDYGTELQSLSGQIAVETGAAYFMLEHRYYGQSKPFDKPTIDELNFLRTRQALADIAHLLRSIKQAEGFQNSKVIVVGGSYAGNLAAWMKLMYPELVDAALASSAPVLAKVDFYEYLETVTDTFRTYGSQECVDEITNIFKTTRYSLHSYERTMKLKEENITCDDLTIIGLYMSAAQYGTPKTISAICRVVKNCSHFDFDISLESVTLTSVSSKSDDHTCWEYQLCAELGYFQTTSSRKQMFGNASTIDRYYEMCTENFGIDKKGVDQGVINTNRMYGGQNPNVTNVVFVNGDMDPWHRLGILQDLSADAPAIYIKGSSHCHDHHPDPSDTDGIKEARKQIKDLLKKWIGQS